MIKLFWYPKTRAARIVWLLEEAGLPYERAPIDIRDPGKPRDTSFGFASPMGKIPAIIDGDVALADSAAIGLYIADRYPDAGLAPDIQSPARGRYLYWMTYAPGCIEPAMMEKFGNWDVNRGSCGWGNFDTVIETLEAGVRKGPWLLGEMFSAADVLVGSSVYFMKVFGILPDNPALLAYVDRCLERPAYQRALKLDDAEIDN